MDMSAIIIVVGMTALFFGFIVWLEIYSRKNNQEKLPDGRSDINFSEIKNKNEQFLKK